MMSHFIYFCFVLPLTNCCNRSYFLLLLTFNLYTSFVIYYLYYEFTFPMGFILSYMFLSLISTFSFQLKDAPLTFLVRPIEWWWTLACVECSDNKSLHYLLQAKISKGSPLLFICTFFLSFYSPCPKFWLKKKNSDFSLPGSWLLLVLSVVKT